MMKNHPFKYSAEDMEKLGNPSWRGNFHGIPCYGDDCGAIWGTNPVYDWLVGFLCDMQNLLAELGVIPCGPFRFEVEETYPVNGGGAAE